MFAQASASERDTCKGDTCKYELRTAQFFYNARVASGGKKKSVVGSVVRQSAVIEDSSRLF